MPGMDRTGPAGLGPMTGWGMGFCGRGMRRGSGFGRGFCRGFGWRYAEPVALTKDERRKILEAELKGVDAEKQEIEKRLKELK